LGYLKAVVQDSAATARERGASARALVMHDARVWHHGIEPRR